MIGFMLTGFGALASAGWAIMARQADILAIRLGRFAKQFVSRVTLFRDALRY
jgi:hypothetical protein